LSAFDGSVPVVVSFGSEEGSGGGEGDGEGDGESCTNRLPNAVIPAAPTICEFRISFAVANVLPP
jgi:hypothetical protein